ncbi:hypothetical protein VTN77DRAFT_7114 [Rasamsonia byssochlamydoides]|uniref:uncharacterized protein n=1 Tax=Rasamsonia byssochlamydoides TaxID=89139 RepID=UPI0037427015
MASKSSGGGANRLSFAKIAAMPPPSKLQPAAAPHDENHSRTADELKSPPVSHNESTALPSQPSSTDDQRNDAVVSETLDGLERGVQSLELSEQRGQEGSESSGEERVNGVLQRETSFDDDQTHLSNSSTKPTSFDSKSMASVTTFAMDEKDSLRPDDSASVQAADEEESLSGPASGAPNSLTGSEAGARGFREPFREGSSQKIRGLMPAAVHRFPDGDIRVTGAIPPDSVSNNFVVPNSENFQPGKPLHGFPTEPDEKLLEAMNSPKDRLLLLQLEEKIRNFIQNSKEQSLELPPSNAFGRLLAHKLGDYYHLTHFVDNSIASVRLHRTPFCRLPTPLSQLRPANANNTPSPNAPAMKIMRRTEQNADRPSADGSIAASSSAPSKAASETGGEGGGNEEDRAGSSSGATPAKDRTTMTREEREAKYQEARERIFRDFPESKSSENNSGDNSANMSRSSSANGRRKNFRQKTPHDDSFEVRSQFNVYYPGMPYTTGPVPMHVAMHNGSFPSQPPYVVGPGASPPTMSYAPNGQNSAMFSSPMNSVHHYPMAMPPPHIGQNNSWQAAPVPQQSPFPGYASMNQPSPMMGQQSSTRTSPAMNSYAVPNSTQFPPASSTPWASPPYQGNFSQSPQRNAPVHWPNYPSPSMAPNPAPYPYGQLPGQHFSVPVQNSVAHPVPGSYSRPPFNPQTRSFVPGGSTPSARYSGKGAQHGANVSYAGSQAGGQQPWTGFPDNHGQPATHISSHSGSRNSNNAGPSSSNPPRGPSSGNQDSIAKWGTPAHLPPKPPPSEVRSDFDIKGRNSSSSSHSYPNNIPPSSKNGPLVVSGGTSLPKSN